MYTAGYAPGTLLQLLGKLPAPLGVSLEGANRVPDPDPNLDPNLDPNRNRNRNRNPNPNPNPIPKPWP